ncbi:serine hydrolase domain-containing protein [Sphingopyxis sp.]|jgi:CubicO group peptidase (beta-lactamase class C family)|uniref:serine hydrolase domain-containing protein n=1 Tax=Sphingopyxis sp. TaxID=1908224 RepID=UPI002DF13DB8|nr:serine hydrolase domain-containing protein [Sphingopyxis sp.]
MIDRRAMLKMSAMFGAGAALSGCMSARVSQGSAPAFGWTLQPPAAAGMTEAGIEGIRAAIEAHIKANDLSGAVTAVARHGKLVWYEAQGLRVVEDGTPMRKTDIFRLMSSSKPVTAACILMLQDAGKLSIDDSVSRFLPTFRNQRVAQLPPEAEPFRYDLGKRDKLKSQVTIVASERDLTLKDLLTHTNGLGSVFGMGSKSPDVQRDKTLAERIPLLGEMVLDFQPGSRWAYSPLDGFDVLGHVVEIVSGMPLDEFMRVRLFRPLEMGDMTFHLSPEQRSRFVPFYERRKDEWKPGVDILGAGDPTLKYLCGAGGLVGTAHDYMQFQMMLANRGTLNGKRVLSREAVALMSTNHVGKMFENFPFMGRKGWGFGLGVGIVVDPVAAGSARGRGSFGWDGAYGTDGWVDPEHDLAAVYFVQQSVKPPLIAFDKAIGSALAG